VFVKVFPQAVKKFLRAGRKIVERVGNTAEREKEERDRERLVQLVHPHNLWSRENVIISLSL
jgi:hypothetical protein